METITSPKNPKVLAWRALQTQKGREEQQAFLVEGLRMVREALDSDFALRALLLREGVEPAFALPAGVPVFVLSDRVFAAVSETKTPQGVAAVLSRRIRPLSGSRFVALDAVQDPGNVGTIIRTADAAGFDGVLLGPECADLFSSKVLRSTMGSIFRLSFAFPEDLSADLRTLRSRGFSVLSSQLDGEPFYSREEIPAPFVLIVGNEGNGISAPVKAEATHRFRLPMRGGAESLNAAVAAGIMMYDLMKHPDQSRCTPHTSPRRSSVPTVLPHT